MRNGLNKKIFFWSLLLNSIFVYGDTLSSAIDLLDDDSKMESLDSYGAISVGFEQLNIDLLQNDLVVEKGIAKKLNIHLFGYSLYVKSISNYTDLTLVTPVLNGGESLLDENRSGSFPSKISLRYKSLDYEGESIGKFDSYTLKYFWDYSMFGSLDLLKLDYVKMDDNIIDNYANYYSVSFGGTSALVEGDLLYRLSKGKQLPYGFDYGLMEGFGVHVGYAWADGKNPKILLGKGMGSTTRKEDDKYESWIYDVEYSPSLFFTFPIGYVKVAYTGKYAPFNESFSSHGLMSTLTMVF